MIGASPRSNRAPVRRVVPVTDTRVDAGSIAGFAYPHGALDDDSEAAVRECGFSWACGTSSHSVPASGANRYALPRLGVLDWDGPAFQRALQEVRA